MIEWHQASKQGGVVQASGLIADVGSGAGSFAEMRFAEEQVAGEKQVGAAVNSKLTRL